MQEELLVAKTEKKVYEILPHEPEAMASTLFIIGMAAYYMWRMFVITPQHEELESFFLFINNGPLYSAINWPSPNNHIGYSVLSAFMNFFGNNYIGLRGVSYICAISNLILVNRICQKYFTHAMPFGAMVLYASMQVVNDFAVQGRGYTLATFCFLLALYCVTQICKSGEANKLHVITYIICVVYGVYTTPSSIYWAVPVCLTALVYLFINGFRSRQVYASDSENIYLRKLNSFIASTGISIFLTLMLYTIIWLMVGARELVKTEGSQFFGDTDFTVLIRNPVAALGTGLQYMFDQRRINAQNVDLFGDRFLSWIVDLLNYMIPGMWFILFAFIASGLAIMITECIRHFEYSRTVINLMVIINILYIVLILISTHNLPSLRGFGYGSFLMTICICSTFEKIINVGVRTYNKYVVNEGKQSDAHKENEYVKGTGKWYDGIGVYIPVAAIMILFVVRLCDRSFTLQMNNRENDILNSMYIADIAHKKNPCVLDSDQDYLLNFAFGIDCNKTNVTGCDVVILDRNMLDPGYKGEYLSRFYQTQETIDWEYLDSMHIQYENDSIILYTK
ncbi:glycosyltransferase family 39 protein [Butyrivibrio sp. VCB2006]|uniref:glycosyltransferase family 39 protein n=1 Tax=Butyrivibrio sp. VCB2006 TaxID=1280679 RepID=UPI00040939A5|nr:glycosyltransferase family 39 protein [Butyrivibrio sp. VCB2006]